MFSKIDEFSIQNLIFEKTKLNNVIHIFYEQALLKNKINEIRKTF